jgi:NAD(P)-dependent dehydrogenase (short-subunit alcohol dehydrogenase family)
MGTNVVIGAGSGMGAAAARLLAPRGPLLIADRDVDTVAALAAELGGDVTALPCDITVEDEVKALAERTGELAGLVLTAGLSPSLAPGRAIWEVNLVGTARVLRLFEPTLRRGSAAVCFASTAGHMLPLPEKAAAVLDDAEAPSLFDELTAAGVDVDSPELAYCWSKRGVIGLVRQRAATWGARGARLLSLSPGIIDTPMGRAEAERHPEMAEMVRMTPLGREARAEEVATVAAFLLSDDASFMTGTDVLVDGGYIGAMAASQP